MRFCTVVVLLGAAASASATTLLGRQSAYPTCAIPCLQNATTGSCIVTDYHCLCTNESFVSSTTQCIYNACQGTDLQNALSTAKQVCASVGVTLTSTPASTPTSSATTSSSTPTTTAVKSGASKTGRNAILGLCAAAFVTFCL